MRVQNLATAALVSTLSLLTATIMSLPLVASAQTKPPTVTVVNPVTNPVNTRITNSVLPVEVSNADPIPVSLPESEGSREIFRRRWVDLHSASDFCRLGEDGLIAPTGKRIVINHISVSTQVFAPSESVLVRMDITEASSNAPLFWLPSPPPPTAVGAVKFTVISQPMHVYVDDGFGFCVLFSQPSAAASPHLIDVTAMGYFVNKP